MGVGVENLSIRSRFAIGSAKREYFYLCTHVFLSNHVIVYNGNNLLLKDI